MSDPVPQLNHQQIVLRRQIETLTRERDEARNAAASYKAWDFPSDIQNLTIKLTEAESERDAAIARADEYKRETETAYADIADAMTALRFYAETMNHKSGDVGLDAGNLARAALAAARNEGGDGR